MQTDAPAPEFPRPIKVSALPPEGRTFKETADGQERAALAERFGARKVKRFAVEGRLSPEGAGWRLTAEIRARITQTCVVTLEPVDQLIEEPFTRLYLPDLPEADESLEVDLDPEEDDEPEPLGRFIDPGEAAAEAAALVLDPYPRAEGIAFARASSAPKNADEITDEEARPRPFAALAELKAKLEKDED
ncbi:YceD family protein [Rhodovulum sp. DZ06]|uniref:YceD family protein n=1 Tax=Rhodovulum sp. DZ06 TaxID=3425126 RepID=UPI003D3293A0